MDGFTRLLSAELMGTNFAGVGIGIAVLLALVLRLVLPRERRAGLRWPLWMLATYVLIVACRIALHDIGGRVYDGLGVVGVFVVGMCISRLLFLLVIDVIVGRRRRVTRIVRDLLGGAVFLAVVNITLRAAGVQFESLLTTSALLTAVIGLSLQETLGNLFAGLSIQAQQPFTVGDWIAFDDSPDRVGKVTEINWRATTLLTVDDIEVVVPNGVLAKAPIRNFTQPLTFTRLQILVQAPYDVPPRDVHAILLSALEGVVGVIGDPPPTVVTNDFGDRGVQYLLRFYTDDYQRRAPIMGEVRDRAWYALARAGITMPYTQHEVHVHQLGEEHDARSARRAAERRSEVLRGVVLFASLGESAIDQLAARAQLRHYAPGETVIRQGDEGDALFAIVRGAVRVLRGDAEVARLMTGQFFGEMSLMTGEKRTATVRASEGSCELLVVDKEAFRSVLDTEPKIAETISEILAERQAALSIAPADAKELEGKSRHSSELLTRIKHFFALG